MLSSALVDLTALNRIARANSDKNGLSMDVNARAQNVPSPQADDFEKVIDLTEFLAEESSTKENIATRYPIVPRQVDYYVNAARYLGLVEDCGIDVDGSVQFQATQVARGILAQSNHIRQFKFAELILQYGPMSHLYSNWRDTGTFPSKMDVVKYFERSPASRDLAEVTLIRRSTTIRMWLKWVCELGPAPSPIPDVDRGVE